MTFQFSFFLSSLLQRATPFFYSQRNGIPLTVKRPINRPNHQSIHYAFPGAHRQPRVNPPAPSQYMVTARILPLTRCTLTRTLLGGGSENSATEANGVGAEDTAVGTPNTAAADTNQVSAGDSGGVVLGAGATQAAAGAHAPLVEEGTAAPPFTPQRPQGAGTAGAACVRSHGKKGNDDPFQTPGARCTQEDDDCPICISPMMTIAGAKPLYKIQKCGVRVLLVVDRSGIFLEVYFFLVSSFGGIFRPQLTGFCPTHLVRFTVELPIVDCKARPNISYSKFIMASVKRTCTPPPSWFTDLPSFCKSYWNRFRGRTRLMCEKFRASPWDIQKAVLLPTKNTCQKTSGIIPSVSFFGNSFLNVLFLRRTF